MKYKVCPAYYADFNTFEVNKLPPRSYFIPYPDENVKFVEALDKRYKSPRVICLNGDWDFKYFENPNELGLEFDTEIMDFTKIAVPSVWQYKGFCHPTYLNTRTEFFYNPPKIPTTRSVRTYFSNPEGFCFAPKNEFNHCGVYRRSIEINDLNKRYILSFLGVSSCMELYVNGSFVGYSEESHNTAEFDITEYLNNGNNEIVVIVRRWCNGTYLECQDMFRNTGIFRDVLLRIDDVRDIWDVELEIAKKRDGYRLFVNVILNEKFDAKVSLTLSGDDIYKYVDLESTTGQAAFILNDLNVKEWNAESPALYELMIECNNTVIYQKIAFKQVTIANRLFTLNGSLIKLRGVNHHDTSPINGYYMTPEEILRDIKLCKEYNVNCIRTSHYAPDPLLIDLCAEYGIYVVDECDLETHASQTMKPPYSLSLISNNKKWMKHYVSRIQRHFNRDKLLQAPIIMWSLGNESGDGVCTEAMYNWLKYKTNIPIHYEGCIHAKRKAYDIGSRMYAPVSEVIEIAEGKYKVDELNCRPFFLCEYAHAMGTGPGNIEGYWDVIYKYDCLMGGCIWEMNDHAVLEANGEYTYGGDHNEFAHDGNFCCDGLFYPDRTPSTGAYIMRHAYCPLRISYIGNNEFAIFNALNFTNADKYYINVYINGKKTNCIIQDIEPLRSRRVKIDQGNEIPKNACVLFETYEYDTDILRDKTSFVLNEEVLSEPEKTPLPNWFDLADGYPLIGSMRVSTPYTILWRAETDNDVVGFYKHPMLKNYNEALKLVKAVKTSNQAEAVFKIKMNKSSFVVRDKYEGCSDGVLVTTTLTPISAKGDLVRFGKAFVLNEAYSDVEWFGCDLESYKDMYKHATISVNKAKVKDMVEHEIRPQESGNRYNTYWAKISNGAATISFTAIDRPFELGVKPYSDLELTAMKHRMDEKVTGSYITISQFQRGIGTGSCGPSALPCDCYSASEEYTFKFIISLNK